VAALLALEAEIGASLKVGLDHQLAHTRLAWWREECARCAAGTPVHPLTRTIDASFAGRERAALGGLTGLIDVVLWDLAAATFGTRRELTGYCERWASGIIVPLTASAAPEVDTSASRTLGAALRELELLQNLAQELKAGRVRLPLDELAAAEVEPERLVPPWPPALSARLSERHAQLRAQLAAAVLALPRSAQAPLRPLLVWAALAHLESQRVARRLPEATRGGDHHGPLDGWRAWRAARRAGAGRLAL
jgi:15-cis-phytoene synthase